MIPTKLLYLGAAGEHHVMSECFRHQREAFKLPIDRGFDLVVTDAYRHLSRNETSSSATALSLAEGAPLYLQVKSRQAKPEVQPPSNRPTWEGCFPIKKTDIDLIIRTPNAVLVCVLFVDVSDKLSKARTAYAWWMTSNKVKELLEGGHFIETDTPDARELWVRYREPESGKEDEQNTYIALFRRSRDRDAPRGARTVDGEVKQTYFDFGKLGSID